MSVRLGEKFPTAFVTGASAGLGRAFVEMLLADGVRVWGTARDAARLAELATNARERFTPVVLDLADGAKAERAFLQAAGDAGGAFDLVINNAGYGLFGEFTAADAAVWTAQVDAMLGTTLRLTHAALRSMRARRRGCVVNVASLAVEFPLPFMCGYNVAKAGLAALSESLIIETRGTGVSVIDFRPGDFRTGFNHAMRSLSPEHSAAAGRLARAWRALEDHLQAAPPPERAAADLRQALRRGRSGTVRSGSWFQARLAPCLARFAPASLRREVTARYQGL